MPALTAMHAMTALPLLPFTVLGFPMHRAHRLGDCVAECGRLAGADNGVSQRPVELRQVLWPEPARLPLAQVEPNDARALLHLVVEWRRISHEPHHGRQLGEPLALILAYERRWIELDALAEKRVPAVH